MREKLEKKDSKTETIISATKTAEPRRRGRPKGAKNKPKQTQPVIESEVKPKKRGRPKKSETKIKEIKNRLTELERLVENVKTLRQKYVGKRVDLKRDGSRPAKPFGYRFKGKYDYRVPTPEQIERGKQRGTIRYEARPNQIGRAHV